MSQKGEESKLHRLWWSSLTLRMVATTLLAASLMLLGGGYLVMDQARRGIMSAKQEAAGVEAWISLQRMQNNLNDTDLRTESLLERLGQLADETGSQPNQYSVIIDTAATKYLSGGVSARSVPEVLTNELAAKPTQVLATPTKIFYQDGRSEPGIAIAGFLVGPSGQNYPVYFLFPTNSEAETLLVLRRALWTTGAFLMVALGVAVYLVTRQVIRPVAEASTTAGLIAEGDLDQRLPVKGTDELADLAVAMNHMAATLQDQIKQLENLSLVQRQFVSDVSHELRTPLTTMRMAGELLYESREDFDAVNQRTIELLHHEIERFDVMLADLLEISRFDAKAAILNLDQIDLASLVKDEVAAHEMVAQASGSELILKISGRCMVEADATRIRRIVRNLIGNAISHSEANPVICAVHGDAKAVALTVRDYGVGLAPDQVDKVFIRFWRADASRNRVLGGTGLGLAISLEDARLHNGWLEAWGELGKGAAFRLTLPINQQEKLVHSPLPLVPLDAGEDYPQLAGGADD